jgi:hypothetical protein
MTMAKQSKSAAKEPPRTKDRGQLSVQIDVSADKLAALIAATRNQKNDAMAKGDLDKADELDDLSLKFTEQYAILIRHQLKKIDDSDLMRRTLKGFADVNTQIEQAIKEIKEFTKFAKVATGIATVMDQLISTALVKI